MEGDSSGQHQAAAINEDTEGKQPGGSNVLTVRETDDQDMGLAVAILELIGSQPHLKVSESQPSESQGDAGSQEVQVLQISETETPQTFTDDLQTQGRNVMSITEISESQKDAIHALETLVQIGHSEQHHVHLDQSEVDHVVIQFETGGAVDQEGNQFKVTSHPTNDGGRESANQSDLNNALVIAESSSSTSDITPAPKRIAVPPVTYTTTSPRTRSKVKQSLKELRESSKAKERNKSKESSTEGNKSGKARESLTEVDNSSGNANPKQSSETNEAQNRESLKEVEISTGNANQKQSSETGKTQKEAAEETVSSPRTRQAERLKKKEQKKDKEEKDKTDDHNGTKVKKLPKKRTTTRRSGGESEVKSKRKRTQLSEQSENENSASTPVDPSSDDKISFHCPTCSQPFTRKDNLKVHMRKKHEEELLEKSNPKLTCFHPECGIAIYHSSRMIEHMEREHGLVYHKQNLEFDTFEEFKRWKEEEEASKFVQFTSSSKEKLTREGVKSFYFKCQRDGNNQPHRKKGLPARKTDRKAGKGSVKSNLWCPARINAKFNTKTGRVVVFYIQSHSHPITFEDTKHQKLPELLRKEIMVKLSCGISIDDIYNDLHKHRDMENNTSPLVNKSHYVSKRFLYMLRSKANASQKLHEDEKTSVKLLVENLKSGSFDPVLMFKTANENTIEGAGLAAYAEHIQHIGESTFVLALQTKEQLMLLEQNGNRGICIDATHTINRWGIQLVTLFTYDDYLNSYPAAYLLSNHIDENVLKAFILAVKGRCPSFSPLLVITDEDNTGLTQFEEIFGQGSFSHLLSKWHVHQAWLKQLKHLVPIISLRQEIYHCLVMIFEEKNVRKCDYMVNAFLSHYADKCQVFTDYFQVTYASRPMKWAMCFLTAEIIACRCAFQDSFHDQVKNFYTQKRKSNKRVDFLTNILLEIAKNDEWCRNAQQFQKSSADASGNKIPSNHERGATIPAGNIKEEGPADRLWKVSTAPSGDPPTLECHEVRKLKELCDEEFCFHKCLELSCFCLCRHLYRCSCVEETQICQHIHRVHMLRVAQSAHVPEHMKADHIDFSPSVELGAPPDDDDDADGAEPKEAKQVEALKQQCQEMFSLLKDTRVRQLLLQHVCTTVGDLVATCEAVKQGAVTVTYKHPVEQEQTVAVAEGEQTTVAEQIIAIPVVETQTQSQ